MLSFEILQRFRPVTILTAEKCFETAPAMHLSNIVFWNEYFRKYRSYDAQTSFGNVPSLM